MPKDLRMSRIFHETFDTTRVSNWRLGHGDLDRGCILAALRQTPADFFDLQFSALFAKDEHLVGLIAELSAGFWIERFELQRGALAGCQLGQVLGHQEVWAHLRAPLRRQSRLRSERTGWPRLEVLTAIVEHRSDVAFPTGLYGRTLGLIMREERFVGRRGRVDIEAMAARLKELGVTTYYWLVWHATIAPNL